MTAKGKLPSAYPVRGGGTLSWGVPLSSVYPLGAVQGYPPQKDLGSETIGYVSGKDLSPQIME